MSEHQHSDMTRWGIAARVIFAFGLTVVVAVGVYLAITWLAGPHR